MLGRPDGEGGRGVADGAVPHAPALARLVVVQEAEAHPHAVGACIEGSRLNNESFKILHGGGHIVTYKASCLFRTCSHGGDGAEEDSDGVSPADGVAVLLEVGGEGLVVQRLDYVHPRVVQGLVFRRKEDIIYGKPQAPIQHEKRHNRSFPP